MTDAPEQITVPFPATYVSSTDGEGKGERYYHEKTLFAAMEETDFQTERLRITIERAEGAEEKAEGLAVQIGHLRHELAAAQQRIRALEAQIDAAGRIGGRGDE